MGMYKHPNIPAAKNRDRWGALPPRPIIITFDDGHYSVFSKAYPVMRDLDLLGINYIVANRVGAENFLGESEIKEMARSGWEIGAHSMTHADLTLNHSSARQEILNSRLQLEFVFNFEIESFAYPFGAIDSYVARKVIDYGYSGAVGLGSSSLQSLENLFYLNRIEVYGDTDILGFANLLPWSGVLESSQ